MKKFVFDNKELMSQWDWDRNEKIGLDPKTLTLGSDREAFWICDKKHSFKMPISRRVYNHAGCPFCSNQRVLEGYNDLASLRPDLAKEWHPTKNDKNANEVGIGSGYKAWWICKNGHEYQSIVKDRAGQRKRGCPYCAGQRPVIGINDLATLRPEIAKEWHPTKNGDLKPTDVMPMTNRKVWWMCHYGHEWEMVVAKRSNGEGCPKCQTFNRTSMPEYIIFFYLRNIFPDAVNSYKSSFLGTTELDIFIPSKKIAVEYDGIWHKQERDKRKDLACKENGIILIRVRSNKIKTYSRKDPTFIINQDNRDELSNTIKQIISYIDSSVDTSFVNVDADYQKIYNDYHSIKISNNLEQKYPELAKEWHPTKNGDLKPENIPATTATTRFWWKCSACGHEWEAQLNNRINGRGCPNCKKTKVAKAHNKAVLQIDSNGKIINEYSSITLAMKETGLTGIQQVLRGKNKTAGGYFWKYK